jgi:hypothetical protein
MYTIAVKQSQGLSVNFVKTERKGKKELCIIHKKYGNFMAERWAERRELPVFPNASMPNAYKKRAYFDFERSPEAILCSETRICT